MANEWVAEFEVSSEQAGDLIAVQFPQLAPVRCESLGVGWDNIAFVVNGEFVFRFPRRTLGAKLMEAELALMPAIAPLLPLAVSASSFIGKPTEQFAWPFGGYRMIRGVTACRANLSILQRMKLVKPLVAFLKSLHRIDSDFAR